MLLIRYLYRSQTYTFDKDFRSVSIDNDGKVYAEYYMDLYELDLDNLTYTHVSTLDFDNDDMQAGIVRNGWLYEAGINPACMYRINVASGQVSKEYPIGRYVGPYAVGEVESIAQNRSTGDFYVVSCSYWGFNNYRQGNVFKCHLDTNSATHLRYAGGSYQGGGDMYVDQNYTGGLPDGSQSKPWPCLTAAYMAMKSPYYQELSLFTINLLSDCANEVTFLRGDYNIHITGNAYKIGPVYVRDGCFSMNNTSIVNFVVTDPSNVFTRSFYSLYARVHLQDVEILQPTGIHNAPDHDVVFHSSVGSCYGLSLYGNEYSDCSVSVYRSYIELPQTLRPYVYFDNANVPNTSYTQASLNALTDAEVYNMQWYDLIILRVVKNSIQTFVQFPVDASHVAQCSLKIGSNIEYYTIQSTKAVDGTFSFSVSEAKSLNPSTATWSDTSNPTLAAAYFFAKA